MPKVVLGVRRLNLLYQPHITMYLILGQQIQLPIRFGARNHHI
jgi:hypothetical protein